MSILSGIWIERVLVGLDLLIMQQRLFLTLNSRSITNLSNKTNWPTIQPSTR